MPAPRHQEPPERASENSMSSKQHAAQRSSVISSAGSATSREYFQISHSEIKLVRRSFWKDHEHCYAKFLGQRSPYYTGMCPQFSCLSAGVSHQGMKSFSNDTRASLGTLMRGSVRGSRMTNRVAEPPPGNLHRVSKRALAA